MRIDKIFTGDSACFHILPHYSALYDDNLIFLLFKLKAISNTAGQLEAFFISYVAQTFEMGIFFSPDENLSETHLCELH